MIEVRISQLVFVDGSKQQYIQLSESHPKGVESEARELMMVIGQGEAEEIRRCLAGEDTPRPLTHQLAHSLIEKLRGRLVAAVIHDMRENTYFAELHVEHQGATCKIDCRPSDAIALSLRAATPIFVTDQVLELNGNGA